LSAPRSLHRKNNATGYGGGRFRRAPAGGAAQAAGRDDHHFAAGRPGQRVCRRCGPRVRGPAVGHGQGTYATIHGHPCRDVWRRRRRVHVGLCARHVASGPGYPGAASPAADQQRGGRSRGRGVPVNGHRSVDQQSGRRRTDGSAHVRRHGARAVGQRGRKRSAVRGVRPVPAVGGVRAGPVRRRYRHRCGGRGEKAWPRRHGHGRQLGVAVLGVRIVSHRTDKGPSAGGRSGQSQLRFRRRVVGGTSAPRRRRPASGGPGVDHRGWSPGHVSRTGLDGGPRNARLLRVLFGVRGEPHVPD